MGGAEQRRFAVHAGSARDDDRAGERGVVQHVQEPEQLGLALGGTVERTVEPAVGRLSAGGVDDDVDVSRHVRRRRIERDDDVVTQR